MFEAPEDNTSVKVLNEDVFLDTKNMKFNDLTLMDYLQKEYGWFAYFGRKLEMAQKELSVAELEAEALYNQKFLESKDEGNPVEYAKCKAASDVDVVALKKYAIDRKMVVGLLKAHISAWNKSHENAINVGHTLRKELDKLNRDIYSSNSNIDDSICSAEDFNEKT